MTCGIFFFFFATKFSDFAFCVSNLASAPNGLNYIFLLQMNFPFLVFLFLTHFIMFYYRSCYFENIWRKFNVVLVFAGKGAIYGSQMGQGLSFKLLIFVGLFCVVIFPVNSSGH